MYKHLVVLLLSITSTDAQTVQIGECQFDLKSDSFNLYGDRGREITLFHDKKEVFHNTYEFQSGGCFSKKFKKGGFEIDKDRLSIFYQYGYDKYGLDNDRVSGVQEIVYQPTNDCKGFKKISSYIYLDEYKGKKVTSDEQKEQISKEFDAKVISDIEASNFKSKIKEKIKRYYQYLWKHSWH